MASGAGVEVAHAYITFLPKLSSSFVKQAKQASDSFGSNFNKGIGTWAVTAGNLIANALQSAIGNVGQLLSEGVSYSDALTRFPLVLESLGVSGDKASVAIEKLNAGLDGTPILVSDATTAVQRLVATTGDVEKSTDWFIALNDAVMAGGAPFAVQQAAIEQWQQAVAKGKPDRIEFRSFMQAFPGVMKQVGIALGKTTAELQTMFSEGELSMEQFNSVLLELDKNGVAGFKNLKEQARQALVGIDTGFGLVRKGIIQGFGKLFQTMNISKQMGVFQDIGTTLEKVIDSAFGRSAEQIRRILEDIIDSMKGAGDRFVQLADTAGRYIGSFIYQLRAGGFESIGNLFKPLIDSIMFVVKWIVKATLAVTEFIAEHKGITKVIGYFVAVFVQTKILAGGILKVKNLFEKLGVAILGFGTTLGGWALLPVRGLKQLGNALKFVKVALDAMMGVNVVGWFGGFAGLSSVSPKINNFTNSLIRANEAVAVFFRGLPGKFTQFGTAIGGFFSTLVKSLLAFIKTPVGIITLALGSIIGLFALAYNKSETFRNSINKLGEAFNKGFEPAKNSLDELNRKMGDTLGRVIEAILPDITELAESLSDLADNMGIFIEKAEPFFEILGKMSADALTGGLKDASRWFENLNKAFDVFEGKEISAEDQTEMLNFELETLARMMMPLLYDAFKRLAVFPWEEIGNQIGGFFEGIGSAIGGFFSSIFEQIGSFFGNIFSTIGGFFASIFEQIGSFFGSVWEQIGNFFIELPGKIMEWLSSIPEIMFKAGQDAIQSFIDGLNSLAHDIWATISNIFGGDGSNFSFQIPLQSSSSIPNFSTQATNDIVANKLSASNRAFFTPAKRMPVIATVGVLSDRQQPVYNFYMDNAVLNDDPQMREVAKLYLKEWQRKASM